MGFQDLSWNTCTQFGDLSFWRYCGDKQTQTQTNGGKNPAPATAVGVGNKF